MVTSEIFFGFTLYVSTIIMIQHFGLVGASYAFLGNALAYAVFASVYYLSSVANVRNEGKAARLYHASV